MPVNEDLLRPIGLVAWAAIRLQHSVRDLTGLLDGQLSGDPFKTTLGGAIKDLRKKALQKNRQDVVDWCDNCGTPAANSRNGLMHAVGYTAHDGKQAIRSEKPSQPKDFTIDDVLAIADELVEASVSRPSP